MKRENEMKTLKTYHEELKKEYEMHPSERAKTNRPAIFNRRSDRELGIIAQAKYIQTAIDSFRDGAITLTELRQLFADFLDSTSRE
jgi:hypothetical protein